MSSEWPEDLQPFPITNWSLVKRAGQATVTTRRQALETLLRRYLPAMRAHLLLQRQIPRDQVEDLLQGFVSDQIVEQNLLAYAQRQKGKLRSFLLVALNRYVAAQFRHAAAQKRCPRGVTVAALDETRPPAADQDTPSEHFDREWAKQLVAETLREMQGRCATSGRADLWGVFEARIVAPLLEQAQPRPYEELAREYALATPLAAANLLTTGKRMFARLLRSLVAEYTHDEDDIKSEVHELMRILGRRPAG
jgi:hypothetical protein